MPVVIPFLTTEDTYPPDDSEGANKATTGRLPNLASIQFTIANASVFAQIAKKKNDGSIYWDEIDLPFAAGGGGFTSKAYGIRFKSASPGVPAVITAVAYFVDDAVPFP